MSRWADADLKRILALPVREPWKPGDPVHPRIAPLVEHLRPLQVDALNELANMKPPSGIFGAIGIGWGKTLITFFAGYAAQSTKYVLFVPPALVKKTLDEWDIWYARLPALRRAPKPTVLSIGALSAQRTREVLFEIKPDLIVIDEAHAFAKFSAARTRRLFKYVAENEDTRVVILTGTPGKRSISDYAHLSELALRTASPLPREEELVRILASTTDSGAFCSKEQVATVEPLRRWAAARRGDPKTPLREAIYERLRTAPGFLTTSAASDPDTELLLTYVRPQVPEVISAAIEQLTKEWVLPDGREIVDAIEFARYSVSLSLGFFYRPIWPTGEVDTEWLEKRAAWAKEVRQIVMYRNLTVERHGKKVHLDSPGLVINAAREGLLPDKSQDVFRGWCSVAHRQPPKTEAVWLDKSVVTSAVATALEEENCLIWYKSQAIGTLLGDLGLPVHGAGSRQPPDALRHAALSISVHSEGKNLQAWDRNLVLEPPRAGLQWQQLLGRTHRPGQKSEEVVAKILGHVWPLRNRVNLAIEDAKYLRSTMGEPQRLLSARWL